MSRLGKAFKFDKFRIRITGRKLVLEGHFNPWVVIFEKDRKGLEFEGDIEKEIPDVAARNRAIEKVKEFNEAIENGGVRLDPDSSKSIEELELLQEHVNRHPNGRLPLEKVLQKKGITRIKELRKTNKAERLKELGHDPDIDRMRPREAEVAFKIEEQYGYFKRYKKSSPNDPKGDWISITTGKTYDHFGMPDDPKIVQLNATLPKQRQKFFDNLDKHFKESDFVVLDIESIRIYDPVFYQDIMNHIQTNLDPSKLIEFK